MSRFHDDDDSEYQAFLNTRSERREKRRRREPVAMIEEISAADEHGFVFDGTRQERMFVTDALREFHDDRWFEQILYKVKGGKEANVYCCQATPEVAAANGMPLVAAKVYRPRMFRAMHNDWFYKQGRQAFNAEGKAAHRGKDLRAAHKDTLTARKIDMTSWCRWEFQALSALHAAGAAVPRPLAHGQTSILMQYLGDRDGAAPTLHAVSPGRAEARRLMEALLGDVMLALSLGRVHADLSAHNILYWQDRAWIIDWPQAVDAHNHPEARPLLLRDLERFFDYLARQGVCDDPRTEAERTCERMWRAVMKGR